MSKRQKFEVPSAQPKAPKLRSKTRVAIARTLFKIAGWRILGEIPNLPKFIAIGGPHTSNWDGIIAVACINALGLRTNVMAKNTIFRFPLKTILKYFGVFPVNRDAPGGIIEQVVQRFRSNDEFILLLAPEGTRKKVQRWKTGFHRIAIKANVPVLPVEMDYSNRTITLAPVQTMTDDVDADIERLQSYMRPTASFNPEQA